MSGDPAGPGPYGSPSSTGSRRRLRPLSGALEAIRGRAAPPTLLAAVQEVWEAAAGDQIAGHCRPVSEHEGKVSVNCDSAVWAAELEMMSSPLRERLNEALPGSLEVAELRFSTAPAEGSN